MKIVSIFSIFAFTLVSLLASASIIKTTLIDGQQYSCRPSSIEPECKISTDIELLTAIAGDSADATLCLNDVGNDRSKVKSCFLQKRFKSYAKNLDVQMVGHACWETFFAKCAEDADCATPQNPEERCGNLGYFLNSVREHGLSNLFDKDDGIKLCRSLIQ